MSGLEVNTDVQTDNHAIDESSPASPTQAKGHRRTSSSVAGVWSPVELGMSYNTPKNSTH